MNLRFLALGALLVVATPVAARAQHSHAAPNGGQIQNIGKLEAELVVKGSQISLYLTDEKEQKVPVANYSASALVLAKGNQQKTVDLAPGSNDALVGTADFQVEGRFRATVTLKQGATEIGKGRFNLEQR